MGGCDREARIHYACIEAQCIGSPPIEIRHFFECVFREILEGTRQ